MRPGRCKAVSLRQRKKYFLLWQTPDPKLEAISREKLRVSIESTRDARAES